MKLQGRESSEEELQNDWLDLEGTKSKKVLDIGMVPSEKDCKIVMVLLFVCTVIEHTAFTQVQDSVSSFNVQKLEVRGIEPLTFCMQSRRSAN